MLSPILLSLFISAQTPPATPSPQMKELSVATFAGGCFWCMEPPFDKMKGVKKTVSGFMGGTKKDPRYKEVARGQTKYIESVQVHFDPKEVSYAELVEVFWKQFDPTDAEGQFVDRGHQYSSAIFFHNEVQKKIAEKSKKALEESKRFKKPIVTVIRPAMEFYAAEDNHQDYYLKNPVRYKYYRWRSGRDQFLKKIWESTDS